MSEKPSRPTVRILPRPPLAMRIMQARTTARLSQARLGEQIGASQSAIADYETGRTEPSMATLTRIADVCGVLLAWLTTGIGLPQGDQEFARRSIDRNEFKSTDWALKCLFDGLDEMFKTEGIHFSHDVIFSTAKRIRKTIFDNKVEYQDAAINKIDEEIAKERERALEWKMELMLKIMTTEA